MIYDSTLFCMGRPIQIRRTFAYQLVFMCKTSAIAIELDLVSKMIQYIDNTNIDMSMHL